MEKKVNFVMRNRYKGNVFRRRKQKVEEIIDGSFDGILEFILSDDGFIMEDLISIVEEVCFIEVFVWGFYMFNSFCLLFVCLFGYLDDLSFLV